jgi:hypothetical protein
MSCSLATTSADQVLLQTCRLGVSVLLNGMDAQARNSLPQISWAIFREKKWPADTHLTV